MAKEEKNKEGQPFLQELDKFIANNKEFLLKILGTWAGATARHLFAKTIIVLTVIVTGGVLTGIGKISGETLAGIVGVVLGYILGSEGL